MRDLSEFPAGPLVLRPVDERVLDLLFQLNTYGKIRFLSSPCGCRLGRSFLRAFSRRRFEKLREGPNLQIEMACEFWVKSMPRLRPREVPIFLELAPLFVSYSDGEEEGAGVGIALFFPDGSSIAGYLRFRRCVLDLWSRSRLAGEDCDIYEIEAVGPALVLDSWDHLIPEGSLWIHLIDNEVALSTLIKGSPSVISGACIVSVTYLHVAERALPVV